MHVAAQADVAAPIQQAWALVANPEVVAACFPGAELLEQRDESNFTGRVRVQFGPTVAIFTGQASIKLDHTSYSLEVEARGSDRRGTSRATSTTVLQLVPVGSSCRIEVAGEISVSGPLSSFAEAAGAQVAEILLADFAGAISQRASSAPGSNVADEHPRPISGFRVILRILRATLRRLRTRGTSANSAPQHDEARAS